MNSLGHRHIVACFNCMVVKMKGKIIFITAVVVRHTIWVAIAELNSSAHRGVATSTQHDAPYLFARPEFGQIDDPREDMLVDTSTVLPIQLYSIFIFLHLFY